VNFEKVLMWRDGRAPAQFSGPGPHELSGADLEKLSQSYDFLVCSYQAPLTKKERTHGVTSPRVFVLYLNPPGKKFTQS
jgi:hypothetical protein